MKKIAILVVLVDIHKKMLEKSVSAEKVKQI